jgi:hypothetical protein
MEFPLYSSSHDDKLRYLLGKPGLRTLHVIGVNPHEATQSKADLTVSKAREIATRNGHDGFVMLNLYPERSRKVSELAVAPKYGALERNQTEILELLARSRTRDIWAAWGTDLIKRDYIRSSAINLILSLTNLEPTWIHYGELTKAGHPRHPSRSSYAWKFSPFNAQLYAARIDA